MLHKWSERVLATEAPGGPARGLSVIVPSIVRPGEPFAVKLAALDCLGYPSVECDGAAEPIEGPAESLTRPVRFECGKPAVGEIGGLTAVRAAAATRTGVFSAIRSRNCYATSAERILIECSIAGADMGQEIAWPDPMAPRLVTAAIAAESNITRVDVVRDGEDVYSQAGDGWKAQVEWTDEEPLTDVALPPGGAFDRPFVYYYLRVTCESGAQAWASPVWLLL